MILRRVLVVFATVAGTARGSGGAPVLLPVIGYAKPYLDERGSIALGAALQVPVTSKLAVRPEYVQARQRFYGQRFFAVSGLWYLAPKESRVGGYLVAGPCFVRREERTISYRSYVPGVLFGTGLHWRFGKRWIAGPEFRLGTNAFPLLTFSIGGRLGPVD